MSTQVNSPDIKILTPSGYQSFEGVSRWWHEKVVEVTFSDQRVLKCALDHRFIVNDNEIFAKNISKGHRVGKSTVLSTRILSEPQWLYDPVNVANGSIYCHDDTLVSHNTFGGTSNTLINGNILLGMTAENPLEQYRDIKIYERPKKGHKYILACDVAKGRLQDYSAFSVVDVTEVPYRQVATYRSNSVSPLLLPDVVYRAAKFYNDAYTVIEANDQGALVYKILYYEYEYEHMYSGKVVNGRSMGLEMTKSVKRIGCSHLKDLIEQQKFTITDFDTIVELSLFEAKGDSYSARDGNHDDTVMALVSFAWLANTTMFAEMTSGSMRDVLSAEKKRLIDESVPAFGVIDANKEELLVFTDLDGRVTERFKGIDDVFGKEFGVVRSEDEPEDDPTGWLF